MSPGTAAAHNHPEGQVDPLSVTPPPPNFWGKVQSITTSELGMTPMVDAQGQPVLKPDGKQRYNRPEPYDPRVHEFKINNVEFILMPLDPTRKFMTLKMGYGTWRDKEFNSIVKPSVEALRGAIAKIIGKPPDQVTLFSLVGLYVYGPLVPREEGSDWNTLLKYEAVFATEEECTAHRAQYQKQTQTQESGLPFPGDEPGQPAQATAPDPVRASLAAFLKPLWDASAQNAATFHTMIAANPMLAQHFGPTSPEVIALTGDIPF
jgi:hypothetical protein